MRDKIEAAIWDVCDEGTFEYGTQSGKVVSEMAQAIIDALPGMVAPLTWDSDVDGTFSIGGCYEILQNDPSKFCFIHRPTDFCSSYFETPEAAQDAANAHHRALIKSAFTVGGA